RLLPTAELGKVVEMLPLPLGEDPRIARDVGDRVVAGDELAPAKVVIEHRIEPSGLAHVTVDCVGNRLACVVSEMMVLAGHRTEPRHLPEQPLDALPAFARVRRDQLAGL